MMDFKILWIDDEPTWVDSIRGGIEEYLVEHGFTPEIIHHEDGDKIDKYIFRADIDMIIIDYNLDQEETKSGAQIIKHVRKKGNFVEIVFYSQDPKAVLEQLSAQKEYVHCVARDEIDDKLRTLIDFSRYKYADLGYMRGSVIGEAIDIENILERIMVSSFEPQGDRFNVRVLDERIYDFEKKYKYVQGLIKSSCKVLEKNQSKTQDEDEKLKSLKSHRTTMANFQTDVIAKRNILAHAHKEWDTNDKVFFRSVNKSKENIDVSREWMMEMRSSLAKYRGVLNQIADEKFLLETEEEIQSA